MPRSITTSLSATCSSPHTAPTHVWPTHGMPSAAPLAAASEGELAPRTMVQCSRWRSVMGKPPALACVRACKQAACARQGVCEAPHGADWRAACTHVRPQ